MFTKVVPIAMAAALAALVVGGVSAASGSDRGSRSRDFTVLDTTVVFTDVDVDNSDSLTTGDQFIEHDVLKNRAQTKELGSLSAVCTYVDVSEESTTVHCVATVELRGGSIELASCSTSPMTRRTSRSPEGRGGSRRCRDRSSCTR